MNIKKAKRIAARIWCDEEMKHIEMDVELANKIAWIIAKNVLDKSVSENEAMKIVKKSGG